MGFFGEEDTAEEITEESVTQEEASPAAEDMFIEATSSEEAGHDTQELEAEDNPPTSVPLQELITERRKRQDIEAEIQEQRQNNAVLNERVRNLWENQQRTAQQQTQNSAPKEEVPDPDEDPLGHANYKINRLESQLRGVAQQAQRQQHQQQQQAQQNAASTEQQGIVGQSQNLQTQFAASNPDYWDAYQFLENTRTQELTAMGYNDSQAAEVVANERGMIVTQSLIRDQNGTVTGWKHNPAEVAYKLAKMRGFAAPAPAAPVVAQVSGQDKFNMAATGSVAGASVGSSGSGAPASGAPTLESIANMSDKDFEKFSRTNPGIIETLLSHG
jgi:hypothetical protein